MSVHLEWPHAEAASQRPPTARFTYKTGPLNRTPDSFLQIAWEKANRHRDLPAHAFTDTRAMILYLIDES